MNTVERLRNYRRDPPQLMLEAADEIENLKKALTECVEQNLNCLYHHHGDNPEGCSVPAYIQRAQDLLK